LSVFSNLTAQFWNPRALCPPILKNNIVMQAATAPAVDDQHNYIGFQTTGHSDIPQVATQPLPNDAQGRRACHFLRAAYSCSSAANHTPGRALLKSSRCSSPGEHSAVLELPEVQFPQYSFPGQRSTVALRDTWYDTRSATCVRHAVVTRCDNGHNTTHTRVHAQQRWA
jgi:hypothetical protein